MFKLFLSVFATLRGGGGGANFFPVFCTKSNGKMVRNHQTRHYLCRWKPPDVPLAKVLPHSHSTVFVFVCPCCSKCNCICLQMKRIPYQLFILEYCIWIRNLSLGTCMPFVFFKKIYVVCRAESKTFVECIYVQGNYITSSFSQKNRQCCGSMTFWGGFGSGTGSADPCQQKK